jgi:DNA-directed RNA polymerase specialized sigma24 family protein
MKQKHGRDAAPPGLTAAAIYAATRVAARWRRLRRPVSTSDLLGEAWLAAYRYWERTGRISVAAAIYGLYERGRRESGRRGSHRRQITVMSLPEWLPATAPESSSAVSLWCDTMPQRLHIRLLDRIWAYLMWVEEWSTAEVAELWGTTPERVWSRIHQIRARWGRPPRQRFTRHVCGVSQTMSCIRQDVKRMAASLARYVACHPTSTTLRQPDAALALGISVRWLRALQARGDVPHVHTQQRGGKRRIVVYPVRDLQAWLHRQIEHTRSAV